MSVCEGEVRGATSGGGDRARRQSARAVLMVRATHLRRNDDTAVDNAFMVAMDASAEGDVVVSREFDGVVDALRAAHVHVDVADALDAMAPDACFPNNWFSTHVDRNDDHDDDHDDDDAAARIVLLYPMCAASRRRERTERPDIVARVCARYAPRVRVDESLCAAEARGEFLEGTGVLVLDRVRRIAFAARSQRCSEALVREWCARMRFEPVVFDTRVGAQPVYHTNVLLSIGTRFVVVCDEAIVPGDRERVLRALRDARPAGAVVRISLAQMAAFCANVLEVSGGGALLLVMSTTAHAAFTPEQRAQLRGAVDDFVVVDVHTIEAIGGGGVRCMLAELF
jgi:hypothetical protein